MLLIIQDELKKRGISIFKSFKEKEIEKIDVIF